MTEIYDNNNILSPLRGTSDAERTNPSFVASVDTQSKPPHPISSFASPSADKSLSKVVTSRSADSLAGEDLSGVWRDVAGDDSVDEGSDSRSAGIALDTNGPCSPLVSGGVGVATASRITTADVVQSVGVGGIHSSPLLHNESAAAEEVGTFIEKKVVTISSTAVKKSDVETTEQNKEWKTFTSETTYTEVVEPLTPVERAEEVLRGVVGHIRFQLEGAAGNNKVSDSGSGFQLLQTVVNVLLLVPMLLVQFYSWLLLSVLSALSSAASYTLSTTVTVICLPWALTKHIVRTLVNFVLNQGRASNVHVQRY
eukprot:gene25177-31606_t